MALLDDVRMAVRVTSEATDAELQTLIDFALDDMRRAGVRDTLLDADAPSPMAKMAVIQWAKSAYGYDNAEAERFQLSYTDIVRSMLNSSYNVCDTEA